MQLYILICLNTLNTLALKTKDAIVDQFRANTGKRPNVDLRFPDLKINVHIDRTLCTISLDTSGESLHRRGIS